MANEALLDIWRVSPRDRPTCKVDALNLDKPVLIYSGGQRDWIERENDEKLKELLYRLITGEQGAQADCDMYVLGVNNVEQAGGNQRQKLAYFEKHADAMADELIDKLIPPGSTPESIDRRLRNVTFFGFSRGCAFADRMAERMETRLVEQNGFTPDAARQAVGLMAGVYTAYSPLKEEKAFTSAMPAAIFMDSGDDFVSQKLEQMGFTGRDAPLLRHAQHGTRQLVVGNSRSGDLRTIGYDKGMEIEKSRSLTEGHSIYLDTNITRTIPVLQIRTFQVRPYAHIIRELMDSLLGGAHSFPSDRAGGERPGEVISRTVSHYMDDSNVSLTEAIMDESTREYRAAAARIRNGEPPPARGRKG